MYELHWQTDIITHPQLLPMGGAGTVSGCIMHDLYVCGPVTQNGPVYF